MNNYAQLCIIIHKCPGPLSHRAPEGSRPGPIRALRAHMAISGFSGSSGPKGDFVYRFIHRYNIRPPKAGDREYTQN